MSADDVVALAEARGLRDDARGLLKADIALLRDALADRPLGQRIRERAVHEAGEAIDHAKDIAGDNKPLVATICAVMVGWMLRGPIGALLARLTGHTEGEDSE